MGNYHTIILCEIFITSLFQSFFSYSTATYPSIYLEKTDAEVAEYYKPLDFIIGNTIFVFGRRMLLHKCDENTRRYYTKALNITQVSNNEVRGKSDRKI